MGKKQKQIPLPPELEVSEEENAMRVLYDFAYYLENMPGKAGMPGALAILRLFLAEREKRNK